LDTDEARSAVVQVARPAPSIIGRSVGLCFIFSMAVPEHSCPDDHDPHAAINADTLYAVQHCVLPR